ncbi:protein N-lysine methyltransferase METTL21A [Brassica rapa]|uniref:Methyltransferase type 12 domain-containing protein n=1 Tax=Brassica campestris TaxID=3711 RepID=M4EFH1_BRACM|nr:protein N-lysine methyltransferase METTL21A [Brassica rapa]XP_022548411.2 protein N-lysine methyltransferase METTL21A [Brassica napus]
MKFTDSPVIELTVNGTQLSIQQDNATMHVGTSVWPCSLVLAKFAERWSTVEDSSPPSPNPYAELLDFRGRRAVELGTGCGVAGMAFHLLGLTEIVLTDMVQVMPALKHNLKRNKAALGKYLKTSVVCWNNRDQISALNPPFDLVIAADVVYIEESVGHLVTAMESLMKEDGAVLLGYQVRSPEADKLFWELCGVVFEIEKVPHEHLHPEYAYEEADVYIFRKKAKSESE